MSKRHIPESHSAHPNVTPLIDIIMCLIIFFMLVAKIGVTTGADSKIIIPTSIIGTKIDDMSNTLTLNIPEENMRNADSEHPIVHALVTPIGGGKAADTTLLLKDPTGQNVLFNTLNYYKKQNDKFKVIIRASADLDWRFIEPVLLTCQDAGIVSINFNTAKAKD
jgi:biopolymer transport protein ExbD